MQTICRKTAHRADHTTASASRVRDLVVETTGFTDQSWLDAMGHPHTDRLRVLERYRRPDVGRLSVEVTIDDPGAYTAPISYTVDSVLLPDEDLLEYFCTENEKDVEHYQ